MEINEELAKEIKETHELVKKIHVILWQQRLYAWLRFVFIWVGIPLLLYFFVTPFIQIWQQDAYNLINKYQSQLNVGTIKPGNNQTLNNWCQAYCNKK